MNLSKVNSPEEFYRVIPMELGQNIQFRIELHKLLATDTQAQDVFVEMCRRYRPIIFSSTFWTYNPQKSPGYRNQPFILRPAQIKAVEKLSWCLEHERDAAINKNRKEGASEICCKFFAAGMLLDDDSHFIVGSRKKELVDNYGDPTTLFAKIDNVFNCLPQWWLERCGYNPKLNRKDMVITVPSTNSSCAGETTNENFSAGSRGTILLLDEIGRVPKDVAEAIDGSVHDVADCVIYSSTHWLGRGHTFNQKLEDNTCEIINLMWYDNPEENHGLYTTSEAGEFTIVDKDYYSDEDLESAIIRQDVNDYDPKEMRVQFIVDGLKGIPSPYRSPWFDAQQFKRRGNKRDFICNVCGSPLGAADTPFDSNMLEEIRQKDVREPDFEGELLFDYADEGVVDPESLQFTVGGQRRLKWWGELPFSRPNQRHTYVIGIDPSYGLGSANSAIQIFDVNIHEQVGSWTDSTTKPEDFADVAVALAHWIGGVYEPFLVWEANAGCGQVFGNRVIFNHYYSVYTQRVEDSKTRKKTKKWGWRSNTKSKEALLGDLGVALSGGLAGDASYLALIIHEKELLNELADYIFKEKGQGIVASSKADLGTGATERHGDRGIAMGLCVLGAKEQDKGEVRDVRNARYGTFQYFLQEEEKKQQQLKRDSRRFLY